MDIVGENIRKIRASRGLLQKELAYLAKMNPSNLSKLERGEYTWTKANLERVAKALNVSLAALFAEEPRLVTLTHPAGPQKGAGPNSDNSRALGVIDAKLDRILVVLGETRRRA